MEPVLVPVMTEALVLLRAAAVAVLRVKQGLQTKVVLDHRTVFTPSDTVAIFCFHGNICVI